MSEINIKNTNSESNTVKRYGIVINTNNHVITIVRFCRNQEILDLILSSTNSDFILYRTQYIPPSDYELECLENELHQLNIGKY